MTRVKEMFCRAISAIKYKLMSVQPTSTASKIAKMAVLVFTMMIAFPDIVYAAEFIEGAINMLGIVVIAIGAGLGIWGIVNLLEGYGNDNPGAKSQGIKHYIPK